MIEWFLFGAAIMSNVLGEKRSRRIRTTYLRRQDPAPQIKPELALVKTPKDIPEELNENFECDGLHRLYDEFDILEGHSYGERRRRLQEAFCRMERSLYHDAISEEGGLRVQNLLICTMAAKNCEEGRNDLFSRESVPLLLFECCRMLKEEIRESATSEEAMVEGLVACEAFVEAVDSAVMARVRLIVG